ncbi:hypothetical protein ACLK1S_00560 [Escherichia coli]
MADGGRFDCRQSRYCAGASILSAAADAGIEIVGDIELFCREAQAPIVAMTGSNGKARSPR